MLIIGSLGFYTHNSITCNFSILKEHVSKNIKYSLWDKLFQLLESLENEIGFGKIQINLFT